MVWCTWKAAESWNIHGCLSSLFCQVIRKLLRRPLSPSLPHGSVFTAKETPDATLLTCTMHSKTPFVLISQHFLCLSSSFLTVFSVFSTLTNLGKHPHWNQWGEASTDISASRKRSINYSWWEDHRQSITLCMKSSTSRPMRIPLVMHHPDTSPPPSVVSGLWWPSFLNGANLIGLLKWCSLNWISQAWVTTAKVPHLLLCWITNGAGHPRGGDTKESKMTPWLVWALSP